MGTLLVGSALVICIALIIRSMVKSKKSGKLIQCGGDCNSCHGSCH